MKNDRRQGLPAAPLLAAIAAGLAATAAQAALNPRDTSVQMFRWSWNDIATESSDVQGQIVNCLRTLLNMGVDGFRIDAAKHMPASAPQSIMNAVKSTHPLTKAGEPIWVTQEIIPDGGVTRSDYFSIGTVNEFQFTYAMRDVFRGTNGPTLSSIPSIMGTWGHWGHWGGNWGGNWGFMQPQFATIFINNWDTERQDSLNIANDTGAINDTAGAKRCDLANIFMLAQGYGEAQPHSGFRFTNKDADRPTASPSRTGSSATTATRSPSTGARRASSR